MERTNMFGKTYNTIGSTDSNFIIKTKGDLKVQWGGKFIDIIKNGKLASAGADILKVASSSDDISSNGVYLVPTDKGNEVWVSIDGTKVNIAGEVGTMYVSFLDNLKDVTTDLKYTALVNSGFYYETIEDAQKAGISAGIIYVVGENKLYVAKDGLLQEYPISKSSTETISNSLSSESIKIPEVSDIEGVKELIKLAVPSGTIVMYNGLLGIPEGWAICDGNNGTPNLVGKFIKAVSSIAEIGDNESELGENNEFTITLEHLPKHSHPHKSHTHTIGGTISGTTGSSGDLTVSLRYSDYNWGIESVLKTFVTSVTGEGVTSETGTVDGVSNIKTLGGNATGGNHTHSVSLNVGEGVSLSSSTSLEETLEDSKWPNKSLKIEPRSYSLVFIMKL